jgi:hypothetical protein
VSVSLAGLVASVGLFTVSSEKLPQNMKFVRIFANIQKY